MPDKKISALPLFSGDVDPADLEAIVDTSATTTKKLPYSARVLPYIILRDPAVGGHRWKFTVDGTGMLSMPGEDLGV